MSRHTDFVGGPAKIAALHSDPKKKDSAKRPRGSIVQRTMEDMRASFQKSSVVATTRSAVASASDTKKTTEQKPLVADDDGVVDLTEKQTSTKRVIDSDDEEPSEKGTKKKRKTSRAVKPKEPPPPSINEWHGLVELARRTGAHSVTTVDPGTRNFALMRMEFYPVIHITHVKVLELDALCRDVENYNSLLLGEDGNYPIDAQLFALRNYIIKETRERDGCFNSSMVLVEEQHFSRDMARIDACIAATINSTTTPLIISQNNVPRCQVINPRSVKACYRRFFPPLERGESSGAFGMGDVRNNAHAQREHNHNKMNAKKWGSLILSQKRIGDVVPAANMTDADQIRVLRAKSDDLYDALWMALYFGSCYLFNFNKIIEERKKKSGLEPELFPVLAAPPQRPHNCFQEIFEVCAAIGTPLADVQQLLDKVTGKAYSIVAKPLKK